MATDTEKANLATGRQVGSVFVLPADAAIRMVQQHRDDGVDVFGVEGFRLIGDRIQPQQEHSCDFDESVLERHERTMQFLADRLGTDLWFEVVAGQGS